MTSGGRGFPREVREGIKEEDDAQFRAYGSKQVIHAAWRPSFGRNEPKEHSLKKSSNSHRNAQISQIIVQNARCCQVAGPDFNGQKLRRKTAVVRLASAYQCHGIASS